MYCCSWRRRRQVDILEPQAAGRYVLAPKAPGIHEQAPKARGTDERLGKQVTVAVHKAYEYVDKLKTEEERVLYEELTEFPEVEE